MRAFSRLEPGFARSSPRVALNRMFLAPTGRKKHQNRKCIGIFENLTDNSDNMLGCMQNTVPVPSGQVVITADLSKADCSVEESRSCLRPALRRLTKCSFRRCGQHRVEAAFSFTSSCSDDLRVYARIAVNCLAALKGQARLQSGAFAEIRRAILTGEGIEQHVWRTKRSNPVPGTLRAFPEQLPLGKRCHAAVFVQREGWVYGIVSLDGMADPMIVKLGMAPMRVETDFYICDWERRVDYTRAGCVLKICRYDADAPPVCGGEAT